MIPGIFDSWSEVWTFAKIAIGLVAITACLLVVVLVPIGVLIAHDNDVNRQSCERRGGHWIVTGSNDHDGEIRTCLDEGGHVR